MMFTIPPRPPTLVSAGLRRWWAQLTTLFLVTLVCLGPVHGQTSRREQARDAAQKFVETHNFIEGRGLSVVPGIYELVDLLRFPVGRVVHRRLVSDGFGLNLDQGRPVGLFSLEQDGFRVGAFGCVACHSSRVAGQLVIGAGNKNIDVGTIGRTVLKFEKPYQWTRSHRSAAENEVVDRAFAFMRKLTHPRISNMTRGVVSINHVNLWFYEQGGVDIPATIPRGGTKVPPLWGIQAKATQAGLFYDGLGKAGSIGWLALPELVAGQKPEVIRKGFSRIEGLWDMVRKLEPPAYPFPIDRSQVGRGAQVYAQSCQSCHGAHGKDAEGLPVYAAPLFNTIQEVGTDTDRIDGNTDQLKELIARNPLADLIQAQPRVRGYFATRLDGVWANFPYLHNGSVPTLRDLLRKPADRPRAWSVERTGDRDRFDTSSVGYTVPVAGSFDSGRVMRRATEGARDVYFTDREGHSSRGHDFGTTLSDADKRALIEYLKTL